MGPIMHDINSHHCIVLLCPSLIQINQFITESTMPAPEPGLCLFFPRLPITLAPIKTISASPLFTFHFLLTSEFSTSEAMQLFELKSVGLR